MESEITGMPFRMIRLRAKIPMAMESEITAMPSPMIQMKVKIPMEMVSAIMRTLMMIMTACQMMKKRKTAQIRIIRIRMAMACLTEKMKIRWMPAVSLPRTWIVPEDPAQTTVNVNTAVILGMMWQELALQRPRRRSQYRVQHRH